MKRESYLRALSSEHHQALVLAREIVNKAGQPNHTPALIDRVRAVCAAELEPHFEFEEQVVLPELVRLGQPKLVAQTMREHRQLRKLIERLEDGGALEEFADLLQAHVRFEEQSLFPACQDVFDETAVTGVALKATHYSQTRPTAKANGEHLT